MKKQLTLIGMLVAMTIAGCSKDANEEPDTEYPAIDISANTFPQQCSEIKRGETFTYRVRFSDNRELGSSSVDIHHNFDHHSHSTVIEPCNLEPKKTAVKPFLLIRTYDIPAGLKTYDLNQQIQVPADVDPGDYHFSIRVTDKEGWQSIKGLSIKII
ncbi:DUF4625 domain-containing protein [Longitalea luteola]|uniref:DUF4625 domain-containing protein n=1 Tax=Longitalea luteola TaxID=2812563 RepID=UPI001A962C29|nr:DUF4625 domain-containing protein [Longitalea luteola]